MIVLIRNLATKVADIVEPARLTLINRGDEPIRIGGEDVASGGRELRPTASVVLEGFTGGLWAIADLGTQRLECFEEITAPQEA